MHNSLNVWERPAKGSLSMQEETAGQAADKLHSAELAAHNPHSPPRHALLTTLSSGHLIKHLSAWLCFFSFDTGEGISWNVCLTAWLPHTANSFGRNTEPFFFYYAAMIRQWPCFSSCWLMYMDSNPESQFNTTRFSLINEKVLFLHFKPQISQSLHNTCFNGDPNGPAGRVS